MDTTDACVRAEAGDRLFSESGGDVEVEFEAEQQLECL